MPFNILLFGITRDIVGRPQWQPSLAGPLTVADLRAHLYAQYPALASLRSLAVAVNNEYAEETQLLAEGDEIALIPPVSGG
ncbi:MAG: molybdopterin converting factor subunit 1 [Bernardetiaceae bacterium]|jgi:molybdopterin synthase sulfur carrier subunit|nr:molybdopterin converting factor subunit 1 [Bernardetiaceae bacterium]